MQGSLWLASQAWCLACTKPWAQAQHCVKGASKVLEESAATSQLGRRRPQAVPSTRALVALGFQSLHC